MKHLAVLGLGGVGGYLGGMLAKHYEKNPDVTISFICRGDHLQQIKEQLKTISEPLETIKNNQKHLKSY